MKRIALLSLSIFFIFYQSDLLSNQQQGSRGPIYVSSAWNLLKGDLTVHAGTRLYFNNKSYSTSSDNVTAVTYWNLQGRMSLAYGLMKHLQIGLSQVLYQDNHKGGKGYNLPDDLYLNFKYASQPLKSNKFNFGGELITRIPLAEHHNIILEPYSAGKLEAGVIGLLSFTTNPVFPENGINVHANLGLIDHNDHGVKLNENSQVQSVKKHNSRQITAGLAMIYPTTQFDFSAEVYGNYYISKPPQTAFSRHNYLYFTPGITYSPFYWLAFKFGLDLRLTPNKSSASHEINSTLPRHLPSYPTWRVNFGFKLNLSSKLENRFADKKEEEPAVVEKKEKTIYEQIADEQKNIEDAVLELETLIKERKKMDEILTRLRKALEIKDDKKEMENK